MELNGQNAMLERLCRKHDCDGEIDVLAALRELLQAVQERDVQIAKSEPRVWGPAPDPQRRIADRIAAQTYADLFPESTEKEEHD